MSVVDIDLTQLADAYDSRAHRILEIDHLKAPRVAMLRMAKAGKLPHRHVGDQVVFYLPLLREHMARRRQPTTGK